MPGRAGTDLAARIRTLRRPTLGAWLANLLALEHSAEVRGLLELGPVCGGPPSSYTVKS